MADFPLQSVPLRGFVEKVPSDVAFGKWRLSEQIQYLPSQYVPRCIAPKGNRCIIPGNQKLHKNGECFIITIDVHKFKNV